MIRFKCLSKPSDVQAKEEEKRYLYVNENMKKFVASESTVQNTWGVMLAQVRGMGPDAAEAIANLYPTPTSVYETFEQLDWDESRCVDLIAQIQPKERKIGRSAAQNLYEAFFR